MLEGIATKTGILSPKNNGFQSDFLIFWVRSTRNFWVRSIQFWALASPILTLTHCILATGCMALEPEPDVPRCRPLTRDVAQSIPRQMAWWSWISSDI